MPCAALAAPPAGETERRLKALTVKRKRKPVGGGECGGGNTLLKAMPVELRLLFQFSDFTFLLLPHTQTHTCTAKLMHVYVCVLMCVCSVIAAIIDFKPRTIHVNCSSRIRFHNWRLPSGLRPTSEGKVWPMRMEGGGGG